MNAKLYNMQIAQKTGIPNYFKKIGLTLIILAFLFAIGTKLLDISFEVEIKKTIKIIGINLIIIGMFFIAFAKDKIEDEMTLHLKLKSIMSAFIFGIIYVIIYPFAGLLFNEPIGNDMGSQQLIITVLLIQIMTFYGMKKSASK